MQVWHPDLVLSPCGGGGLLSGLATAVKGLSPQTQVYGVEPELYNDHFLSKNAGRRVRIEPSKKTRCDSLMATIPGELTWLINRELVDNFLLVSERDVARAVSFAARYLKLVVEPGGAVALAALLAEKISVKDKKVVVILSGGNIDPSELSGYLKDFPDP
ncbi:pyridoxal-phosphate dependent enzyme [Gammaproteobacteria bacterium]|nr:pyridoxal-phosphate dependent enzyme [Gammaproteobacteria bacterium]